MNTYKLHIYEQLTIDVYINIGLLFLELCGSMYI